ncbi:peroxisomal acyl-coenzyme A oxidase 3-like [Centruroides sculpturatus]|nr:peroxisomal acyl-coenzyme A oxidase 3-like [Centruroides sculpturatus]
MASLIKDGILSLCSFLKNEAIALADVISPPDFILNSVLGNSDGQVYEHLYNAIVQRSGAQDRPFWWKEFLKKPSVHSIRAKL